MLFATEDRYRNLYPMLGERLYRPFGQLVIVRFLLSKERVNSRYKNKSLHPVTEGAIQKLG